MDRDELFYEKAIVEARKAYRAARPTDGHPETQHINSLNAAIASFLRITRASAGHSFLPPFENYWKSDIGDQNGHVCTAENPQIAQSLVTILNIVYSGGM